MPMKLPKAAGEATALFEAIRPTREGVAVRLVFGQPAAFVAGNMFLGVFGDAVFVRLSEEDRAEAAKTVGAHPFEPMPGRPMREYVVLPAATWSDARAAQRWVDRSLAYAARLPPKGKATPKARSPATGRVARSPAKKRPG